MLSYNWDATTTNIQGRDFFQPMSPSMGVVKMVKLHDNERNIVYLNDFKVGMTPIQYNGTQLKQSNKTNLGRACILPPPPSLPSVVNRNPRKDMCHCTHVCILRNDNF